MKKFIVFYFSFCVFFFSFFVSGFVDSQDGFQYLAVARRFYHDGTFALPEEVFPEENVFMTSTVGNNGERFSPTGLGYSIALLPAVIAEDIILKISGADFITAFPLNSDWPVLLFASFTNSVFGALLTVTMYLLFRSYKITHKSSIFLSFVTIVATNLFPYTKHTMAHMMQISFFVLSFFFLRKALISKTNWLFLFSGSAFGVALVSYNPTFIYPVIPFGVYYIFLKGPNIKKLPEIIKDLSLIALGVLPFYLIYNWFNWTRFGNAVSTGYGEFDVLFFLLPPAYIIYEGIWSVLLSPGRSFFLYSPILLITFLFWTKLKKPYTPEVVSFIILFLIYIYLTAVLQGGIDYPVWHGESSWGPRYLTPLIPFLMILVGLIYSKMSKVTRYLIFAPLVFLGIYIQLLGIIFPYQIKFAGLMSDVFFNGRNFNVYEYANQIPRYSPVFKMTKTLTKRILNLPNLFNHGQFNLRLIDGFNMPFDTGQGVWREIMPTATIQFNKNEGIKEIDLLIANHLIETESIHPVKIDFSVNQDKKFESIILKPGQETKISIKTQDSLLTDTGNFLQIKTDFLGTNSYTLKNKQIVFLKKVEINKIPQNISTIDFPYVSGVSRSLAPLDYLYWGKIEKDPWQIWHIHSGVYEQTFDFWWVKPFHYWDLPKHFYAMLFLLNVAGIAYFGLKTFKAKI